MIFTPGTNKTQCPVEGALYLGNSRILIASGDQVKIFNYKTIKTETLPNLPNINNTRKLFRMSDGRVAVVGEATLSKSKTLYSGETKTSDVHLTVIEILDINKKTVSEPIEGTDITFDVWSLPNDRLLFGGADGLALYDLQQQRWLAPPEALVNIGYTNEKLTMQLSNRPMIIKLATKLSYIDYTKKVPLLSGDTVQDNATVLPTDSVELFIPETGPWGYYDAQSSHFNWWLWFLTLQLMQGFAGLVIMLTQQRAVRRFLIPL
jgi:hypothetical protein